MTDIIGNYIKKGSRCIRADLYSSTDSYRFVWCTVMEINENKDRPVSVLTDGKELNDWTYPERLIVM